MNKSAIVERYGKALQFYLTYIPSDDHSWDKSIWQELKEADAEVRKHELEGTPEYNAAVLRADQISRELRMQRRHN